MTEYNSSFTLKLFYSYSHKDAQYREQMEIALTQLRQHGLSPWSDQSIRAGEKISVEIKRTMDAADIFVFLMSPDFIASDACAEEWDYAEKIAQKNASVKLIPVIIRPCSWNDFRKISQFKALPKDGNPVTKYTNMDAAWKEIYDEIKLVIEKLRTTFIPRIECIKEMQYTEFISQDNIPLRNIFVFPKLTTYSTKTNETEVEVQIKDDQELLESKYTLVYGDKLAGKTALCRYLFLELLDCKRPVLYIDLESIAKRRSTRHILETAYREQFSGDFSIWNQQNNKLIILENLTNDPKKFAHVQRIVEQFDSVLVTVSTDIFYAFFRDHSDLSEFLQVKICPLTHTMQESLIRKRMATSTSMKSDYYKDGNAITDGVVDSIENQVNSIIISNKILPRYPFYVLSILQTYEGYMPNDLAITSYGHCYHVLIVSHLHKVGISRSDDQLEPCFNFGASLAFEIFRHNSNQLRLGPSRFEDFVKQYELEYIIPTTILNRMCDATYGIVLRDKGGFRYSYMYYYFLGKYLAKHIKDHRDVLDDIVARSYAVRNCLALIFTIHHTDDTNLIDDIVLQTMCSLDGLNPSKLDAEESNVFDEIVSQIRPDILSPNPVSIQRAKDRDARDLHEASLKEEMDSEDDSYEIVNEIYRVLKNNEILGQILRNKYGSLQRQKIDEIVETIADGGLRLVKILIGEKEEIHDFAAYLHRKFPEIDYAKLRKLVDRFLFCWTLINIEHIVNALNKPELRKSVDELLASKDTPAYDLIRYFLRLDTISKFSKSDRDFLKNLWNKHRFPFFQRVVSLRTQHYFNTHTVDTSVEQSACSILGIKYKPRLRQLESVHSDHDSERKRLKTLRESKRQRR